VSLTFTVPGNPVPWQRAQSRRGQRFTAPETRRFQAKVQAHARQARAKPLAGPVLLAVDFYRETAHACDLDNLIKTVSDALNGIAYEDDRQIVAILATKNVDRSCPRVMITVSEAA